MLAPPRMGLRAQRVRSIRKWLRVEPSTRHAMDLSRKPSARSQPVPPIGVMTRSTWPTPLKQGLRVQGQLDDVGLLDGEKRERFAGLLEVGRRRGLDVPRGRRDVGA